MEIELRFRIETRPISDLPFLPGMKWGDNNSIILCVDLLIAGNRKSVKLTQ